MAMVVKNNMSAVRTLNTLNKNSSALQKSLAKVSSGMKINSAQDDASGYAISERMRVQIRSLDQANQNTQNASSLMKTAEGAVSSTVEILKSLKEKAINAATDTNTDADRATIQKELDQFIDQIDDNALTTFNGKYLVDGSKSASGAAVATAMTNQSLASNTKGTDALTSLKNRNGESLEISSTDFVTASYVMNGSTYTTKFKIADHDKGADVSLNDVFKALNDVEGPEDSASKAPEVAAADSATATTGASGAAAATSAEYTAMKNAADALVDAVKSDGTYGSAVQATPDDAKAAMMNGVTDGTATTAKSVDDVVGASILNVSALGADGVKTQLNNASSTLGTKYKAYTDAVKAYNDSLTPAGGTDSSASTSSGTGVAGAGFDVTNGVQSGTYIGQSAANDPVNTADGTAGLTIRGANAGLGGQISGLTLSITDSEGNVKKSANAALDAFKTTIYAKNASSNNEMSFQVGASANQSISVSLDDMRSEALGLKGRDGVTKVSVATQDKANAAVAVFDNAIQKVLDQQATIGAVEARLEYTSQNLTTSSENVQAAESTIRDADMAKEMTNYTKNNVLLQAAQSMLAQANQNSSAVLSLLQ